MIDSDAGLASFGHFNVLPKLVVIAVRGAGTLPRTPRPNQSLRIANLRRRHFGGDRGSIS